MNIRKSTPADAPALVALWRRSVEATHAFLTPADVDALEPEVAGALGILDVWVAEADGKAAGFMGMHGAMVEALFVDPLHARQGIGKAFIAFAKALPGCGGALRVDVNEQNPGALAFYLAQGFRKVGRSETDGAGRNWPLIHLAMEQ